LRRIETPRLRPGLFIGGRPLTIAAQARKTALRGLLNSEQKRNNVPSMFRDREVVMLRIFVEEAAALTSIALFVGMIAVWAQLLTAF
jgi:hypothetical protein